MYNKWLVTSRRCRIAGVAAAVLLAVPAYALASEDESGWTIADVDGVAHTGKGQGVWWSMQLGENVPPGNHIVTGPDGRVNLIRGGDSIEVGPDSEFSLSDHPEAEEDGIIQTFGSLLFRMESRESRDFTVETPFLAAAIKGTTFSVTVTASEAAVAVDEGSVEVTDSATGAVALVGAGDRISSGRDGGSSRQGRFGRGGARTSGQPIGGAGGSGIGNAADREPGQEGTDDGDVGDDGTDTSGGGSGDSGASSGDSGASSDDDGNDDSTNSEDGGAKAGGTGSAGSAGSTASAESDESDETEGKKGKKDKKGKKGKN